MKTNVIQKLNHLRSKFNRNSGSTQSLISSSSEHDLPKWYQESFSRVEAERFLMDKEIGVFVIRKSETHSDSYVLTVRVPKYLNSREVSHYLIISNADKDSYSVKGFQKEFADLKSLVTHCSLMRDILPVMLNVDFYKTQLRQEENYTERRENDLIYCFFSSPSTSTSSLASIISSQSELSDCDSV